MRQITPDSGAERAGLTTWLARLGLDPDALGAYAVLAGGLSGATVYRVTVAGTMRVLKVTAAGAAPHVVARARREVAFYRELAPHLPLRVPEVIAAEVDADRGSALLLAAYTPAAPAPVWKRPAYLEVVRQLAGFHAVFWDAAGRLAAWPWLRPATPAATTAALVRAWDAWSALAGRPAAPALPAALAGIETLLARIPAVEAALAGVLPTICHGDCHLGNLLRDAVGNLRWADWQEVGPGCGPADLAFLIGRAVAAGGRVPEAALITAYHAALAAALVRPPSHAAVAAAVAAAELRTSLLDWPAYLQNAPPPTLATLLARIRRQAAHLGLPVPA